jgi:hypothetical protein
VLNSGAIHLEETLKKVFACCFDAKQEQIQGLSTGQAALWIDTNLIRLPVQSM